MSAMVAALFVQRNGTYWDLPGVDPWDEKRDARKYAGPWPVVAHPPCQLWVNLACVNFKRYGGEHNRPGNDGGCFASALRSVRAYGGVLEHPADSHAWSTFDLPSPPPSVRMGSWHLRRLGLRGLAVSVRAQGAKAHVALLRRVTASRAEVVASSRHTSGRLVRSQQANPEQARGECDSARLSRRPHRNGKELGMKILVCGGRHYSDEEKVRVTLARLFADHEERILIHGGAPGADTLAGSVARAMGATVRVYPADWKKHGRTAGPMRNQQMLDAEREGLDWVVAFPGGVGTADMVRRARKARVKVLVTR